MSATNPSEQYYRVFAFGHGHGALISERFSRDSAEKRRRELQESMPDADVRIERVNANGWPVRDIVLRVTCPRCGPVMLGVEASSYQDGNHLVTEYRTVCDCGHEIFGFVPSN